MQDRLKGDREKQGGLEVDKNDKKHKTDQTGCPSKSRTLITKSEHLWTKFKSLDNLLSKTKSIAKNPSSNQTSPEFKSLENNLITKTEDQSLQYATSNNKKNKLENKIEDE